jgi:hypothetical protein
MEVKIKGFLINSEPLRIIEGGRRQKAGGRSQEAGGRRQEPGGRRQEAEGRTQKAEGRRQEAEGRRQEAGARRRNLLIGFDPGYSTVINYQLSLFFSCSLFTDNCSLITVH